MWNSGNLLATLRFCGLGLTKYQQLADLGLGVGLNRPLQLEVLVQSFEQPWLEKLIQLGAITAMLGVLLNLVLGLSRVYLALGRRNDLPKAFAKLDAQSNPRRAVLFTGVVVAVLCLMGDVRMTWSLSAVTVLLILRNHKSGSTSAQRTGSNLSEMDISYWPLFVWSAKYFCRARQLVYSWNHSCSSCFILSCASLPK